MNFRGFLKHQAPFAFLLAALCLVWATGNLHFGGEDAHQGEEVAAAADEHAGHGHAPGAHPAEETEAPDPHAGHDHGAEAEAGEWCAEHNVPESACTICNPSLAAAFKAQGDWCAGHNLPESVCPACNPVVDRSFDSLAKPRCEHDMPMVECDGCRFELGVVKVDPALEASLMSRGRVTEESAFLSLDLTGQVTLDRSLVVEVPSPAVGRVLSVEVGLGDQVEEGDLLAVIHSGPFGEAKARWLEALTNREVAESERERQAEITTALGELVESLRLQAGEENGHEEGMLELPAGAVGEWKSKLVSAAAKLRVARLNHEREKALEEKGISAASEHEVAHHAYEAARAEYASLLEEVKLSLDLDRLKAENSYKKARAAVMVAEQQLRIFGLDDEDLARLQDAGPGVDFGRLEIRAPRSGTITAFDLSAGHLVEADEMLLIVADLSKLWIWCDVYARDLGLVAEAVAEHLTLDAEVRVPSFPDEVYLGVLDIIGSEMDVHTRTVKVRLLVDNDDGRLRPGMFADVTLGIPLAGRALVVPRTAVLSDEGDSFVFQYWKDDLWVRRDVTVVRTLGDRVQIEGGLQDGAVVATGGAFMLKSDVLREKMGAG